jgi:hypothetical protein
MNGLEETRLMKQLMPCRAGDDLFGQISTPCQGDANTAGATFATRCLWAGVDLRIVRQWLGHSDMESTMRYLKPSRSEKTREKVNEIFGGNQDSTDSYLSSE